MKDWTMVAGGGKTVADGKSDWPDLMRVQLQKRQVVDLLHKVAAHIDYQDPSEEHPWTIDVVGQLAPTEEPTVDEALVDAVAALRRLESAALAADDQHLARVAAASAGPLVERLK